MVLKNCAYHIEAAVITQTGKNKRGVASNMPVHVSQIVLKRLKNGRIVQSYELLSDLKLLVEISTALKFLD